MKPFKLTTLGLTASIVSETFRGAQMAHVPFEPFQQLRPVGQLVTVPSSTGSSGVTGGRWN